jgi:hypothetical protein
MDSTCQGIPAISADDGQGVRFTLPDCSVTFYLYYTQDQWLGTVRNAQRDGTAISVSYDDDSTYGPGNEDKRASDVHPI